MHQIIQSLNDWYSHALQTGGYPAIVLMMAVESSLFPLPSELVIPPAAYLAAIRQGFPARHDGRVLFPFRRLFIVAYR